MPYLIKSPYGLTKPPAGSQLDWGHPLAQGLVALLPFNEASGRLVNNLVQTRSAGAFQNTPIWQPVQRGVKPVENFPIYEQLSNAVKLDGSSSYIKVPYYPKLICPTGITLEVIARLNTGVNRVIIGKPFAATHTSPWFDYCMYRDTTSGRLQFRIGSTVNNFTGMTNGVLAHIVLTADGVNMRCFVNGKLDTTVAASVLPTNTNSQDLHIGANVAAGEVFDGWIMKAAVYERALRFEEVEWLYEEPFAMLRGPDVWRRYISTPSGNTFTVTLDESMTVSDTPRKLDTHIQAEAETVADALVRVYSKILPDSVSLSDETVRSISKVLAESVTPDDRLTLVYSKAALELIATQDATSWTLQKYLSDSVSADDAVVRNVSKVLAESMTVVDNVTTAMIVFVSVIFSESMTVQDAVVRSVLKLLSDPMVVDDRLTLTYSKTMLELIATQDAQTWTLAKIIGESVNLSDSAIRNVSKLVSESIPVTDERFWCLVKIISEDVTLSDAAIRTVIKILAESISVVDDVVTNLIVSLMTVILSEQISVQDAVIRSIAKLMSEPTIVDEAVVRSYFKFLADTVPTNDVVTRAIGKALTESQSTDDRLVITFAKAMVEQVQIQEGMAWTVQKYLADSIALSDTVVRNPAKVLSESIDITDVLASTKTLGWLPSESMVIIDSRVLYYIKIIGETIAISEDLAPEKQGDVFVSQFLQDDSDRLLAIKRLQNDSDRLLAGRRLFGSGTRMRGR